MPLNVQTCAQSSGVGYGASYRVFLFKCRDFPVPEKFPRLCTRLLGRSDIRYLWKTGTSEHWRNTLMLPFAKILLPCFALLKLNVAFPGSPADFEQISLRWIHIAAGIIWLGTLSFFI